MTPTSKLFWITNFVLALLFIGVVVFAWNNPSANPPGGSGAIAADASNNVGIGTTIPTGKLTIRKPVSGAAFTVRNIGDTADTFAVTDTGAVTLNTLNISGLTSGSVPFAGASGLISEDNANLFWDSFSRRLGIGTKVPVAKVTVRSIAPGSALAVRTIDDTANVFSVDSSGAVSASSLSLTSPVSAGSGGTGQSAYSTGDLLYASGANALSRLSIGAAGQVLTVSGGKPVWNAPAGGGGGGLTFGGMYSVYKGGADCSGGISGGVANPLTGGYSCPAGFADAMLSCAYGVPGTYGGTVYHYCYK